MGEEVVGFVSWGERDAPPPTLSRTWMFHVKHWFVVRGSWFVVRGSWFVVRDPRPATRRWGGGDHCVMGVAVGVPARGLVSGRRSLCHGCDAAVLVGVGKQCEMSVVSRV